jgi:poly(3-hydroxybutyrate) depolymerase
MRWLVVLVAALVFAPAANAQFAPAQALANTEARLIHYVAHDGVRRTAWLLLPIGVHGPLPLIISPHGRGVDENENALIWGDLPGEGGFAVINPAGEGRRLHWFSWGAPGQIADLARMPEIVRAHGVDVDRHRIYAFGGSMGGQKRSCSRRSTLACSQARLRSTRRPTCGAGTTTSLRSSTAGSCSGWLARRSAARRTRCPAPTHAAAPTTTCGSSRSPACRCRSSGARVTV